MSTYGDLTTLKVGDTVLLDGYYGELTRADRRIKGSNPQYQPKTAKA
jgi:hypothetical protein